MDDALTYILNKYGVSREMRSPIDLPTVGRDDLALLFAELGYRSGVEIGVESGEYTEVLAKANPKATIYCVDAWKAYRGYRDHVTQEKIDGFLLNTRRRLAPYNCNIIQGLSMDVVGEFADRSLDFAYIDGNHSLEFVINDLIQWAKKVRKGGCIAGHDMRKVKGNGQFHVVQAVNAYTDAYKVKPWFVCRKDRAPSFFWVKE
jgi:predicted O-methyltransferase YrrM